VATSIAAQLFPPVVNAAIALGVLGGMLALVILRRRRTRQPDRS
jgi:hypothetical protein